jgi:hypothetical protein
MGASNTTVMRFMTLIGYARVSTGGQSVAVERRNDARGGMMPKKSREIGVSL